MLVVGAACSTPDVPIDPETGDPMPVEQPNEVCGRQRGAGGRQKGRSWLKELEHRQETAVMRTRGLDGAAAD